MTPDQELDRVQAENQDKDKSVPQESLGNGGTTQLTRALKFLMERFNHSLVWYKNDKIWDMGFKSFIMQL